MSKHDFKHLSRNKPIFSQKKARARRLASVFGVIGVLSLSAVAYQWLGDEVDAQTDGEIRLSEIEHSNELGGEQGALALNFSETADTASETVQQTNNTADFVLKKADAVVAAPIEAPAIINTVTVKDGDSLAKIFKREGYSASTLHYLVQETSKSSKTAGAKLKAIRPGHTLEFTENDAGEFVALRYPYSLSEALVITKEGEKTFSNTIDAKPITFQQRFATATISSSFYNAGLTAELPDGIIMELAGIFEYDIDFGLEIRKGDSFSVLYQEKFIDGKKVGYGDILSAEFTNDGDLYSAVQYTDEKGRTAYYTPDGKALRKSFLRAPLKFNYVSSNFNPKRFHPIQKRVKPHRGVDYRAAIGTPVRASGDGRVIKSAYDRFNGNYVFIQHGNNIVTKYLHFSKRAVKKGQRVKQGQIVGYVGNTGMSQAPHLHYEFVVNGVHRNPRKVKLPHAAPVPKKEMDRFKTATAPLLSDLSTMRTEYFARLSDDSSTTTTDLD